MKTTLNSRQVLVLAREYLGIFTCPPVLRFQFQFQSQGQNQCCYQLALIHDLHDVIGHQESE